jgi:hypothetical protein
MDTISFKLVLGVNEGYTDNGSEVDITSINELWLEKAEAVANSTSIYISGISSLGHALYRHEWGCPEGGEPVVIFTGSLNSEFCKDAEAWKQAVRKVSLDLKKDLKQTTATLEFSSVDMEYLT